ncbi:hypothetical protein EOPP23_06860 [Endozoicomonas sp. OPT23]|uniref:hypothetical protein n=1 Tax=Endozoicomonas sp. OPT23 TaxID=2072845 RepID=UPI00129AC8C8|nr:hypothetical protein [Endozoicomonas sp. OPT23]MRI32706.1 hypothetical protein [Endozoicomonas sp. OPT23]
MKAVKRLVSAIIVSAAASSLPALASVDLYASSNGFSGVSANLYKDGKPVEGAKVQLLSNGGTVRAEEVTDKHGRANFNFVSKSSSVVIKASAAGKELSQWVNLDRAS